MRGGFGLPRSEAAGRAERSSDLKRVVGLLWIFATKAEIALNDPQPHASLHARLGRVLPAQACHPSHRVLRVRSGLHPRSVTEERQKIPRPDHG